MILTQKIFLPALFSALLFIANTQTWAALEVENCDACNDFPPFMSQIGYTVAAALRKGNLKFFRKKLSENLIECKNTEDPDNEKFPDFYLHRLVSPFFRTKKEKYVKEKMRLDALQVITSTFGTDFLFQTANKKVKGKSAFEWALTAPAWTKGTLFLLANGLVPPDQYEKLGISRNWDGREDKKLLFNIEFEGEDQKLANQAFLQMIISWNLYFEKGYNKRHTDDSLLFAICSLENHFIRNNGYDGLPFFWRDSYYYSSLLSFFKKAMACSKVDECTTVLMTEKMGDLYCLQSMDESSENEYLTCLAYWERRGNKKVDHYLRLAKKLAMSYLRNNKTEEHTIMLEKMEKASRLSKKQNNLASAQTSPLQITQHSRPDATEKKSQEAKEDYPSASLEKDAEDKKTAGSVN